MSDPEKMTPVILFVDDEATAVKYFQRAIGSLAPVATADSVEEGKRMLETHAATIKVLVSDQRMPGAYGNELLEFAKNRYPDVIRILTTAYSEIDRMVEAVNQGQIYRYLQKPWEITALRMELKQALDMAHLRSEHSQLLREKMMVRQHQLLANRVGSLFSTCAEAGAGKEGAALEAYLRAADAVGVVVPHADWIKMDYADLIGVEAFRQHAFHQAVLQEVAQIRTRHTEAGNPLQVLQQVMAGKIALDADGAALLEDGKCLVEYLEANSDQAVSPLQISWLAYLIWLDGHGASLQVEARNGAWRCSLAQPAVAMTPDRIAAWIDHFMSR